MSDDLGKSPESELPRPEEILKDLVVDDTKEFENQEHIEAWFRETSVKSEVDWTHLKGLQSHYWHKKLWSFFLMALMASMVAFQSFLLVKVGLGEWDFSKYQWLLPALMVQNLAQVVGLAVFVVKSLFKDLK